MNTQFKVVEKALTVEFEVKGFDTLSEESQKTLLGFSIKNERMENFHHITYMNDSENDGEILRMVLGELLANGFEEISDGEVRHNPS